MSIDDMACAYRTLMELTAVNQEILTAKQLSQSGKLNTYASKSLENALKTLEETLDKYLPLINSLRTTERLIAISRYIEGKSYRDIGIDLYMSKTAVYNACQRIKKKIEGA